MKSTVDVLRAQSTNLQSQVLDAASPENAHSGACMGITGSPSPAARNSAYLPSLGERCLSNVIVLLGCSDY